MVEVSDTARGASRLTLDSGGERTVLAGTIQPAPIAPILVAKTEAGAPALQAFRQTGKVVVANGGVRYDIVAGADRPQVERFFAACERMA